MQLNISRCRLSRCALEVDSATATVQVLQARVDELEAAEDSMQAPRAHYLHTLSKNTALRRKLDQTQQQNAQLTAQLAAFLTAPIDPASSGAANENKHKRSNSGSLGVKVGLSSVGLVQQLP